MRKKIPPSWILPLLFLFFIVVIVLSILGKSNFDAFLVAIICIPVFVAGYIGYRTDSRRSKILAYLIFLFLLFHCLIFPFTYQSLLNSDPASIAIDNQIIANEKSEAMAQLDRDYQPKNVREEIGILDKLARSKDTKLSTSMTAINSGFILVLDSFLITGFTYSCTGPPGNHPIVRSSLCINDHNGQPIVKFPNYGELFEYGPIDENVSAGLLLKRILDTLKHKDTSYVRHATELSHQKGIWSFSKILPYCLNTFTSGNLRPISHTANYIYYFHAAVFWILIFGAIVSFVALLLDDWNKQIPPPPNP